MERALKIIIIVLGVVVITMTVVLVVLFMLDDSSDEQANVNTVVTNTNTTTPNINTQTNANTNSNANANTSTVTNTNTTVTDLDTGIDLTDSAELLSKTFAERYGSFSTDTDFENIEGLYEYMTSGYRSEQTAFVAAERAKDQTDSYGVTTQVVTTQATVANDSYAKYTHSTRRTETRLDQGVNAYNQDIVIELQYANDGWYVSSATWVK